MLWMLGLALALTAPLAFTLRRRHGLKNRREAALALHRAQLAELARDLEDGRIGPAEYQGAKLEVERRLLVADGFSAPEQNGDARLLLLVTTIALPIAGFALYLPGSTPSVPSEPHAQWLARQQAENAKLDQFIALLRVHLAGEDPASVDASQGEAYLGEALAEQAGAITPEAMSLFQQSLAHAPNGASWRTLDEQRIAQQKAMGE